MVNIMKKFNEKLVEIVKEVMAENPWLISDNVKLTARDRFAKEVADAEKTEFCKFGIVDDLEVYTQICEIYSALNPVVKTDRFVEDW